MMNLLDSSDAYNPEPQDRVERLYLILKDTVTPGAKPYLYVMPLQGGADACATDSLNMPDIPLPWPNRKILGYGHTHVAAGFILKCKNDDGTY